MTACVFLASTVVCCWRWPRVTSRPPTSRCHFVSIQSNLAPGSHALCKSTVHPQGSRHHASLALGGGARRGPLAAAARLGALREAAPLVARLLLRIFVPDLVQLLRRVMDVLSARRAAGAGRLLLALGDELLRLAARLGGLLASSGQKTAVLVALEVRRYLVTGFHALGVELVRGEMLVVARHGGGWLGSVERRLGCLLKD